MPTCHERKLYKDQKYLVADAERFLHTRGFRIIRSVPNDCFF